MNTRHWIAAAAATSVMTLAGCASGPNEQLGTVGGAAVGGLIGNQVGRSVDQRNYYNGQYYPNNSYYPNNGPRY